MFSLFASKDAFLLLRMFAKCLSVNLFLSAVLMFFILEKTARKSMYFPICIIIFWIDIEFDRIHFLENAISYKLKEVCSPNGKFQTFPTLQLNISSSWYSTGALSYANENESLNNFNSISIFLNSENLIVNSPSKSSHNLVYFLWFTENFFSLSNGLQKCTTLPAFSCAIKSSNFL